MARGQKGLGVGVADLHGAGIQGRKSRTTARREAGCNVAQDIVYDAVRVSMDRSIPFIEALAADTRIAGQLDRASLESPVDPLNYVGVAPQMVDRVLAGR